MNFESAQRMLVYNSQTTFRLPRKSNGILGTGNLIFLVTPNPTSTLSFLKDTSDIIKYRESGYRYITEDGNYREKIGTKKVLKNEANVTRKRYADASKELPVRFIPSTTVENYLNQKKNMLIDLGRWMQLYFSFTRMNSPKVICERFVSFLANRVSNPSYDGYSKTILFDLDLWVSSGKQCIILNKKLLTNPLSILFYTAAKYPELLDSLNGITLYLISHTGQQFMILPISDLKNSFIKAKMKIGSFNKIKVSNDTGEQSDEEIQAEIQQEKKKVIYRNLREGLLGNNENSSEESGEDEIKDVIDITKELSHMENTYDDETSESNEQPPPERMSVQDADEEINEDIIGEIDDFFEESDEPVENMSVDEATKKIKPKVISRYQAKFMPERTPEELAKIEILTKGQESVVAPTSLKNLKAKAIESEDLSSYVDSNNPNIKSTKFANFDRGYVSKLMEDDIDHAVAALSQASEPIFITGKEVVDSSDAMNIKKTYTYHLKDPKGNRMTIKMDIPVIIDGKYIYINGSKKIIGHQLILKPIVKTSPDVVQLVSWYNKVFLYRKGMEDSNTNMIRVYLEKHAEDFKLKSGSSIMKNKDFETPLDFDVYSKFFYSFQVNDYFFITELHALLDEYKKRNGKEAKYDKLHTIPVAINMKDKSLVTLKIGDSFDDFLLTCFTDGQKEEIRKIKRKPRLYTIQAKMRAKFIPLILFMCYCEGFTKVAQKADIKYEFIDRKQMKNYDKLKYAFIQLEDCIMAWDKTSQVSRLLMNDLTRQPLETYTREDLDNKFTWSSLLGRYYTDSNADVALDNYRDFMMDPVSKEILTDFGYPTDLIELFVVAAKMLCDSKYLIENHMSNMRIRSNEVIANIVYIGLTRAYTNYRKTSYKKKPASITINPKYVINTLLDGKTTNLVADSSSLNPVLELEKGRVVTYKGLRGIQMERAMTLSRRGYDESMLGVLGISTQPDALVGINRQLSLEPSVTSLRGYIDAGSKAKVDKLTSTNLFTPAELLTPLGVQHDDPDRTAIRL